MEKKLCISLIFSNFVVSNYKVIYFTHCPRMRIRSEILTCNFFRSAIRCNTRMTFFRQ